MKKKSKIFKLITSLMVCIFTIGLILEPMVVYANENYNPFGFDYLDCANIIDDNVEFAITFNEGALEDVESVVVETKFSNSGDIENTTKGISIKLENKSENKITGLVPISSLSQIGVWFVDKIKIINNDGSNKVIYNRLFYSSLSNNDAENGALLGLNQWLFSNGLYVNIESVKYEKKTIQLGEEQRATIKVSGINNAEELYVNFYNQAIDKEKLIKAEKVEGTNNTFIAKVTISNSLETGYWTINKATIADINGFNKEIEVYSENFKVVSDNTDINPPVLEGIKLTGDTYDFQGDEKAKFILDISDDISGFNSGYIYLIDKDNTKKEASIYISYDFDNEIYYSEIMSDVDNGTYHIKNISLSDNSQNSVNYYNKDYYEEWMSYNNYIEYDFSNIELTVKNKPSLECEIVGIINNSREVNKNEALDIEIQIKSDKVISQVTAVYEDRIGKNSFVPFISEKKLNEDGFFEDVIPEDGIYKLKPQGGLNNSKYATSGEYIVQSITIYFENSYLTLTRDQINFDLSDMEFKYNNPDEDITAPIINDILVKNNVVLLGEKTEIEVKASDDISGFIESYEYYDNYATMSLYYDGLSTSVSLSYDKESDSFKGIFEVPKYLSTGVYKIESISIHDLAYNYKYYNAYDEDDKELLSKGTILVKNDLKEEIEPVISVDINDGDEFINSITPNVSVDQGNISMTLNGKKYEGGEINLPGRYNLFIMATGLDGTISTKKVSFKVISQINNETKVEDIIDIIDKSEDNKIEININNEEKVIDKNIFEAIKGTDKEISFKQEDGTVWTFNGKDINDENIDDIKISVSDVATDKEVQDSILGVDEGARIIHFDHHGNLPGKASVRIYIGKDSPLYGQDLTFYYFNNETKKIEKIQGPIAIDNEGYITVEITHCSDYFLSVEEDLATNKESGEEEKPEENEQKPEDDNHNSDDNQDLNNNDKNELEKIEINNEVSITEEKKEKLTNTSDNNSFSLLVCVGLALTSLGLMAVIAIDKKRLHK